MRDVFVDASGLFLTAVTKHGFFIVSSYILALAVIFILLKLAKKTAVFFSGLFVVADFKLKPETSLFVVLLLSVLFLRGGISGLPQSVTSAFNIGDAQLAIITMNGSYSVVYGALNSSKEISQVKVKLPADVNVGQVMQSLYPISDTKHEPSVAVAASHGNKQPYNLVFVLLEGWPADGMSGYGYGENTTPFFDSLMSKSLTPLGAISGGVRTTEGIYAIFCSQQNPLGKTVAQTSLQNNQYRCLPDILKQQGWYTAFFQGSHKETSGTGAFAQAVGFSNSYAKEDMSEPRYEHNYWGAHDPDIFDFALTKMDEMPQPFLVGLNTNSTHDIQVPAGVKPFFDGDDSKQKHDSILYFADQALKEFFEKIKQKSFYNNTIFVLLSDHTGGKHKTTALRYFIPGIIYAENIVTPKNLNRYVSHRDFSPTILDILGLPASDSFAGKSFWRERELVSGKNGYFADYFDSGTIGWLSENLLVETSVTDSSSMKCYSLEDGLINAETIECNNKHKLQSINALVFTSYSQNLLFTGKTKSFFQFND